MTYGPLDGKMTEFVYDCRNRLIKAGDTEYSYDAENNRIAVTKDGVTTKYVVDSNCEYSQVLTATTDDSVITYIYGDGLIGQEDEQDYVTYHYNQVGSTTALTDEKGSIIETYEYSPYGDILDGDSSLTMFLYNGKYGVASDDNGLYYMRARYYDISIKRFVNQDVVIGRLDATSSLNRYAYCEGNPVSYLDPFGFARSDMAKIREILGYVSLAVNAIGILIVMATGGAAAAVVLEVSSVLSLAISSTSLIIDISNIADSIKFKDSLGVIQYTSDFFYDLIMMGFSNYDKFSNASKILTSREMVDTSGTISVASTVSNTIGKAVGNYIANHFFD